MFVSILVSTRKSAQTAEIIADFSKMEAPRREMEIRKSGSRNVYLLFKGDEIGPYIEYAKFLPKRFDYIKYIEFDYDDGGYHGGYLSEGEIVFDESHLIDQYESSLFFLEHFTGIRGNISRLASLWAKEVNASAEQKQSKEEEWQRGKEWFDEKTRQSIEKSRKRDQARVEGSESRIPHDAPPKAVHRLPSTRREIQEEIQRINLSGNAFIPFAVFPNELKSKMTPASLSAFASYFDKTKQKAAIFDLVREAYREFSKHEASDV